LQNSVSPQDYTTQNAVKSRFVGTTVKKLRKLAKKSITLKIFVPCKYMVKAYKHDYINVYRLFIWFNALFIFLYYISFNKKNNNLITIDREKPVKSRMFQLLSEWKTGFLR